MDDVQRCSRARGVVLERPARERGFGESSCSAWSGRRDPWRGGSVEPFDLNGEEGEVFSGAVDTDDMEPTLVTPCPRAGWGSVAD